MSMDTEPSASADACPACKDASQSSADAEKESWVRCDACKKWFHWRCVGAGEQLEALDKWFCGPCREANPARKITMKPPARKSSRNKTVRDYADLHSGVHTSDPQRHIQALEAKVSPEHNFRTMAGAEISQEWLENDPTAMTEPVLIPSPEGLGMKMPDKDLTIDKIADIVGRDKSVEVIGWTMGKWAEYYAQSPSARDKIRNVISLEISGTDLADQVLPPRLVRELPLELTVGQDWHIDFAGSSVYYHLLRGSKVRTTPSKQKWMLIITHKVFYFIRPTPANLAAYERWSGTEMQSHTSLADLVDNVVKVTLTEGNTMMIPTGWIHAVYTPADTLVFGGNFLHSYNAQTQLKVREIEIATHVPKKFRFPFFTKLCWYVAEKYLRDLKAKEEFSSRVLDSIEAITHFLVSEARTMERGSDAAKRQAKEQVPGDRVKDAPALARELRWRVRMAAGYDSDGEAGPSEPRKGARPAHVNKRKRNEDDAEERESPSIFRNFRPKRWDGVEEVADPPKDQTLRITLLPEDDVWKEKWLRWGDAEDIAADDADGVNVTVRRTRHVLTKPRRTLLATAAATAVALHESPPREKFPIYPSSDPIIVLSDTPSELELQIGNARRAVTSKLQDAHGQVQGAVGRWIGIENAVEARVKSLIAPDEPLTPGILYSGIAALSGSVLTRTRGLPLRILSPPTLFILSMNYFLPKTSHNIAAYLGELEQRFAPGFAEKHAIGRAHASMAWERAKEGLEDAKTKAREGVSGVLNKVQERTGLKVGEAAPAAADVSKRALDASQDVKEEVAVVVTDGSKQGSPQAQEAKDEKRLV
ncbi:hypothetical protein EWM64_g2277 [Hericium alpestre]|uniref:MICOS complex subunit n=1 Tax=Hericium alpestre TaxID=135208 RepID=A0A4Z0A5S1_9AGAM|nr:hypothetical protein EWM64_g2277 [Hericium alpestre]